tara:strand:- start:1815 stop:2066 length:252 start_codon:yes stop_codon:yes gene_type:complete
MTSTSPDVLWDVDPHGIFLKLLVFVLLIVLEVFLLRLALSYSFGAKDNDDPETILKSRFAEGFIDENEYLRIREILNSSDRRD